MLTSVVPWSSASAIPQRAVPHAWEGGALPPSPSGLYIVQLADPPLASYTGGMAGLPATNPRAAGMRQLNTNSAASRAYRAYLARQRGSVLQTAARLFGSQPDVVHVYDAAYNGMALRLSPAQARQLGGVAGVRHVIPDAVQHLQTDAGPGFIGAAQEGAAHAPALFRATLNGAQEQPPTSGSATGSGAFTYDAASRTLQFQIGAQGLSGPATSAHIIRGAAGTNGTEVVPLAVTATGAALGQTTLAAADEPELYSGGLYVNIGTAAFPAGEIRGQIVPNQGEGMIVGVIDTGINFGHASFAATGADGYTVANPLGAGVYRGACDPNNAPSAADGNPSGYNPAITCNDKLIGAWAFAGVNGAGSPLGEPSPADDDGHGSHTASTAAGNIVPSSIVLSSTVVSDTGMIGGVAPHANIIAYDVCDQAGCFNSAILAAIDQAVKDKVNVLNFSIGGASRDPWSASSPDAIGFLNALDAGIMTSVSAGNNGPDGGTILSPSNAPWVMSAAASTHNRVYRNTLTDFSGVDVLPTTMTGKGFSVGMNSALPIVYAGFGYNNPLCEPFASGVDLSGLIVVCDRGTNGRADKAENVAKAGGAGFVLANDRANGNSINGDAYPIPGVHLTYADGVRLKTWLANGGEHRARITGAVRDTAAANGDIMAAFSSRGPDTTAPNVMKPDLSAPGVDILAAVANSDLAREEFGFESGTSMAAPHVTGAMALLRELHPNWTPSEIYSALMTTAVTATLRNDTSAPAGPFDRGAGRIDVRRAAMAGLVLDETAQNYFHANPAAGGDPRALNRASLMNVECVVVCSWTRVVRNTLPVTATWSAATSAVSPSLSLSVAPAQVTLAPGATTQLTITATLAPLPLGAWASGEVTFSEAHGYAPAAHMPVVVRSATSNVPGVFRIPSDEAQGSVTISGVKTIEITNLAVNVYGLTKATLHGEVAAQDPTPGAPFDSMDGAVTSAVDVPDGTARFVTEVITTTAKDLDLYVALDGSNGQPRDGVVQSSEIVCVSATETVLERCNLPHPRAGHYLVLVQNWKASQRGIDAWTLASGLVPAQSDGGMTVTAPTTQPAGQSFDIKVAWGVPRASGDRWYGAFELGSDAAHARNLGFTAIDLVSTRTPYVMYMPVMGK